MAISPSLNAPSCGCGCGGQVKPARKGGWKRYLNSHHTKNRNGLRFELADTRAAISPTTALLLRRFDVESARHYQAFA